MSAPPDKDKTAQDLAGYLHSESPRRPEHNGVVDVPRSAPPGLSELPEPDVRDMEKSLVERIADVDDDRRRTAVQLRKAFESHRDDMQAQRRRDHNAMLVLAGIGIILLAGGLLLFAQLLQARNALEARIASLEAAGPSAAPAAASEAEGAAAPANIAPDIAALTARLDQLEQQAAAAASSAPAAAATTDDEAGPATEQIGELADAIESIGDRLTALEGRNRVADADASADTSTAEQAAATAAERQVSALEGRLGALLDERLASVEARIDEVRTDLRTATAPEDSAEPADSAAAPAAGDSEAMTTTDPMIVLQLAGLSNRGAVARFMARHDDLPGRVYLKSDTHRGQAWFGVIHSLHPSMEAAEAARAALPADLAELDTWLRPLAAGTRLEVLTTQP